MVNSPCNLAWTVGIHQNHCYFTGRVCYHGKGRIVRDSEGGWSNSSITNQHHRIHRVDLGKRRRSCNCNGDIRTNGSYFLEIQGIRKDEVLCCHTL